MHRKTRTLSAEDRRALDLILNHGAAHGHGVNHAPAGVPQRRLAAAARVLSALDALPAADPPPDLVARTLRRIDAEVRRPIATDAPAVASAMLH